MWSCYVEVRNGEEKRWGKKCVVCLEGRDDGKGDSSFLAVSSRESRKKMKNGKMNGD